MTTIAGLPLSVRWTGALLPALNETYTLILKSSGNSQVGESGGGGNAAGQSNDENVSAARVWLQGKLVMKLEGVTEEEEARFDLVGNR